MSSYNHKFVEFMPEKMEPGVIYISLRFSLVSHQCACGCGEEVVTPISPKDWQLIYDGETISLYPSIGNWRFRCRSHYWIEQNQAVWIPAGQSPNEFQFDGKTAVKASKKNFLTGRLREKFARLRLRKGN